MEVNFNLHCNHGILFTTTLGMHIIILYSIKINNKQKNQYVMEH